jgi:Mn2+/Fe2+ NRAMP family transporter
MKSPSSPPPKPGPIRRFFSLLGPGVVTGAADDDPSGIVTYTIAGAQLGTSLLWTACLTWPLMAAVQMMCARIGLVSGVGLAGALKKKFPRWLLIVAALALFIANTINISADLSGMADVMQLLLGVHTRLFIVLFGILIILATIRFPYRALASVLKWLAAVLFAYVITAFILHPDWSSILHDTFLAQESRRMDHPRRHPRNHDQPVPFLLAGLPGNRGGENQGTSHRGEPSGCAADRPERPRPGRRHWNLLLQFHHVLRHPHFGHDAA